MTCNSNAASRAVRHIGPTWSSDQAKGAAPCVLTRPYDGFSPVIPQTAAGSRMDPPVSEPRAQRHIPQATATADPPELPPGESAGFHGLWQAPNKLVSEV
jgi:hypothetical protein